MGIPTGWRSGFRFGYNGNILVNAFSLGVVRTDAIFLGSASGVGNPVIYVGSKTGKDGIHGATMASEEFGEEAKRNANRPEGDPFIEKLLLEACMEAPNRCRRGYSGYGSGRADLLHVRDGFSSGERC